MRLQNLSCEQADLDAIDEAGRWFLSQKGIRVPHERALGVFKGAGARVEGDIVFIDDELLDRAVANAPSKFTIRARDPKYDFEIGGGKQCICTAYECINATRGEEFWSSTSADVVNFAKIAQSSPSIDMVAPWVAEAHDLPSDKQMYFQYATSLKYVTKPIMGINDGYEHSKRCIQLLRDFYDNHNEGDYLTLGLISPVTPLGYDDRMLEAVFAYAEEKQPLLFASYVMPGATGPITLAGAIAVCHAEVLCGIVLAQLINPGTPVIYGNAAGSMDLRYVSSAIGEPETALITVYAKGLGSKYGLPVRAGGPLSDSKSADTQAGIESTMTMLTTLLAGVDFVLGGAGILDSFTAVGYDKFLFDDEINMAARKIRAGVDTDEDHLAVETVMEVPHGGSYLGEDHTYEYMRKSLFMSRYFEKEGYTSWKQAGGRTAQDNVMAAVDKMLADYQETPLTDAQTALIADYLDVEPN